ncbi:hypothetical protein [Dactylosporangium sp. NPDC050588]|uniref:hypothetical protein n=1 Tax=Dactylosporangium sp. NPDC050588 TaxID=3157211 RepID=UPI0033DA7125
MLSFDWPAGSGAVAIGLVDTGVTMRTVQVMRIGNASQRQSQTRLPLTSPADQG